MRAMSDGTFRGLVTTFEVNQPVNDSGHTEVPESEESRAGKSLFVAELYTLDVIWTWCRHVRRRQIQPAGI